MEESAFFKEKDETLNYTTKENKLQIEFETVIKNKYRNYKDFQLMAKTIFKEMEEAEEINTFFETDQLIVLKDCKETVLEVRKFQVADNTDKIVELLTDLKEVTEQDQQNIEVDLKAIDNLLKIKTFFTTLYNKTEDLLKFFKQEEKGFSLEKQPGNYEEKTKEAEQILEKMMKCMQKVKGTQLAFTIEDTELSDFIENYNGDSLNLEDLSAMYKKCDMFFNETIEAVDVIKQMELESFNEEADVSVSRLIKNYVRFFEDRENSLNRYYTYCYLFRDQMADAMMDETSIFLNILFNKITAYRTLTYIKYYDENVKNRILNHIKASQKAIDGFMDSDSPEKDFKKINSNVNFAVELTNFASLNLTKKKTKTEFFNNEVVNRRIMVLSVELKSYKERLTVLKEEFPILDSISQHISDYRKIVTDVKSIEFDDESVENVVKSSMLLMQLTKNKKALENIVIQFNGFKSKHLGQLKDIISGNEKIAEEIKNILKKVNKKKKKRKTK